MRTVASAQGFGRYIAGWILWLGFIAFLLFGLLTSLRQAPLIAIAFFGVFFIIAGKAALMLGGNTRAYLNFGGLSLRLAHEAAPGGELRGVIRLPRAAPARIDAELVCTLEVPVLSGGKRSSRTEVLLRQTVELALQRDPEGAFVEVRMPIPADAKPTGEVERDWPDAPAQRAWELRLKAPHPGGALERTFPIEVLAEPHAAPASAGAARTAAAVLLAANLLPLALVLAGKASIGGLVILYWAENLIIGFYALLRMAAAYRETAAGKLGSMVFFCLHYGGFCLIHGVFVMILFGADRGKVFGQGGDAWPFPLSLVQGVAAAAQAAGLLSMGGLLLPLLALFASHGVSFVQNYLLNGRYRRVGAGDSFWRPYPRMVLLHVMIIAGAFFILRHGSPLPLLIGLVVGKTLLDFALHWRANRGRG